MIITKEVRVRISYKCLDHYINKGYDAKTNHYLTVNVKDLTKNSHSKIEILCDICKQQIIRTYQSYNKYLSDNIYTCNKCNSDKRKKTCLKKYGVEIISQSEESKNKAKITNLVKYGVDNPSKSKKIKEKIKDTFIEKYGVDNIFRLKEIKDKIKDTFIEKYGVNNIGQLDSIKKKIKKTKIDNKNQTPDDKLTDFLIYKRKIKNNLRLVKCELFNNWNGYDYYDNEYIKENLHLPFYDKNYPTIDHKISIYYGFNNRIPLKIISNIDNLCITKRIINSSKNKSNNL